MVQIPSFGPLVNSIFGPIFLCQRVVLSSKHDFGSFGLVYDDDVQNFFGRKAGKGRGSEFWAKTFSARRMRRTETENHALRGD
jgi:hypothetical protein